MTDRRALLRLAAAGAAGLWLPRPAWSQPLIEEMPFTLGVASGSPLHDSVVLWTRLHLPGLFGGSRLPDAPVTVRWEVAEDEAFRRIARHGQTQALPELAHSVHVEVGGLAADRPYWYRFAVGGRHNDWVSPVGRARTLPAPDSPAGRLRLAYASCQRWEHGYYAAWRHLAAEAPDLVLFLGDYIYEYPLAREAVRSHGEGWTLTLADYRKRYALHRSDPDLQAAHAASPWFVVWDDHEVHNDYAGLTPGDSGPPVADFAARRAAAYQAFYEHMPLRASVLTRAFAGLAEGADLRLHGHVRIGRLATLTLLDTRQYKDAPVCNRPGRFGSRHLDPASCETWKDPARTMLGTAQERWLHQALGRAGEARWTLLGQTTAFGPRDARSGPGRSLWNDGWDGYEAARARLVASLRQPAVSNPVLLGGDVHANWVGHVKADYADPGSASVGVEFTGTSITSRGSGHARLPEMLAENPHFLFADAERRGYGLMDLAADRLTVHLRAVDDVARRDSGVATLASFEVAAGRAVVERAS